MSAGIIGMLAAALVATNNVPGVDGFAQRSDVAQLQMSSERIEARIIAADIWDAQRERCRANKQRDEVAKPGTMRRINTLMADYQRLTGHEYQLPGCEEL